jgi:hypothetical protein
VAYLLLMEASVEEEVCFTSEMYAAVERWRGNLSVRGRAMSRLISRLL